MKNPATIINANVCEDNKNYKTDLHEIAHW